MRLKDYDEREGKRVWLSEREISLLLSHTDTNKPEMDAALIMAARCGLRRSEITQVRPTDLVNTDHGQVIRVWEGKGDKYREVPAPDRILNIALGMNRPDNGPLVSCDESTIYSWVSRCRERAHADTGDEGWLYVGPHDLRRSWGVRVLEAGVLPSVVMEWGGWNDWDTFRNHYLAEFSPEALRRERGKVGWLDEHPDSREGSGMGYAAVDPRGERR